MDRPPFDPTALVLGLLLGVVAFIGLLDPEMARRVDLGMLVPLTLLVAGATLLLASAGSRRRRADRPEGSGPDASA